MNRKTFLTRCATAISALACAPLALTKPIVPDPWPDPPKKPQGLNRSAMDELRHISESASNDVVVAINGHRFRVSPFKLE